MEEEAALRDETKDNDDERQMDSGRKESERSKLQSLRVQLNSQINRELRLRSGAENLLRATSNPKVKETVALELSFVNSNLQLLKEELEELNSCMDPYQDPGEAVNVPMIPLGLKETKEVDFSLCIKDVISEHYGEDGDEFEAEIRALNQLRQATRTPSRAQPGLDLLLQYYNQLYYVDQRFCSAHGHLGALFHWFDSLTGVPSCQKAVAFEKGSVLFNVGALFTQIGARQDRSDPEGIELAIAAFRRAAGAFLYLRQHFCNAPSLDMSEPSLWTLQLLMTAQAQECVLERTTKQDHEPTTETLQLLRLAQETAQVSERYLQALRSMAQPLMKNYVPFSWASMVQVKLQHFMALSHFYAAQALGRYGDENHEALLQFYSHCSAITGLLRAPEGRRQLRKRHLRSALMLWEESLRLHGLCKVLRKMDVLQSVLSSAHGLALDTYSDLDQEDDFEETPDAPTVQAHSDHSLDPIVPDFSSIQVQDLFQRLGPLCLFSARSHWGPVRTVVLPQAGGSSLGLTLRGDAPVLVVAVVPGGAAQEAGLCEGDYIVAVNGRDTKWAKHKEVVELLQRSPEAATNASACPESCPDAPHLHSEDRAAQRGAVVRVVTLHSERVLQMPRSRSAADCRSEKENSAHSSKRSTLILNWRRRKNQQRSHQAPPERRPLTPDPGLLY